MLVTYVACAVLAGPFVGGLIGAAVTALSGAGGHLSTWAQWWLGDALGVLVVATPILAFAAPPLLRAPRRSPWELAVIAVRGARGRGRATAASSTSRSRTPCCRS